MKDFDIANHGSIILFAPLSEAAKAWTEEHIPEDAQWFGSSFVVEPRYARDIIEGIQDDGLEVS